ncbi:FMN-binding domain-containing protein [Sulfurivirga caldicuralii]|uniref:FMN-binding domain-containing protein n=1 Tax=Sulfurivirga caldicuralii TaxID=364032 RepID=A0A1N6GRP8_9GAMM|nr:FMN-binding protein [Sulfurivirga caldicuralii]SIO10236.1 FMN-binding domain-containing protein [Sulfurivirga caldicuralii]
MKWILLTLGLCVSAGATAGQYDDFLQQWIDAPERHQKVFWFTGKHKQAAIRILGHPYPRLAVPYWQQGSRTVWILQEKGKDEYFIAGIVIENGRVITTRILEFKEPRGWEIMDPGYLRQYRGIELTDDQRLSRTIDGITGATLSVRGLKRLVRLALYLHRQVIRP